MEKKDNEYHQSSILIDASSSSRGFNFPLYSDAIINIINNSYPNFTIGIFGEWGTGKTTLMKLIYNQLKSNTKVNNTFVVSVWFNAWMYERENQFALFPLLQTIANSIPEIDENKKKLKEVVGKFGRDSRHRYNYLYSTEELKPWINKVKEEIISKTDTLRIYFNNHYGAKAVINAFEFKKMLGVSLSKRETNALKFAKRYYSRPPPTLDHI